MSSTEMDEKQLRKVIADSLGPVVENRESITEASVTSPKVFTQVTELLSQRTKDAHIKIYHEYVEKLNNVSAKLDTANRDEANQEHSEYRSLKRDEAFLMNSVYLHELYFSNCFDPHSELFMDTLAYMRLQRDWGKFENWQSDFIACCLSNRDGWAICGYSTFSKKYVNVIVDSHSGDALLGLIPVIVVDTHGHAYYRDYLDDRPAYVSAMMKEFNWNVIEDRFKKADRVHEVMK